MSAKVAKENLMMSLISSLAICVPSFCLSAYIMETNIAWTYPAIVVLCILAIAAMNFAAIIILEYYRENIGSLTLPALLATVGLVLLFVVAGVTATTLGSNDGLVSFYWTGQRIDLEAFGPTNAAVFARLLQGAAVFLAIAAKVLQLLQVGVVARVVRAAPESLVAVLEEDLAQVSEPLRVHHSAYDQVPLFVELPLLQFRHPHSS